MFPNLRLGQLQYAVHPRPFVGILIRSVGAQCPPIPVT